LRLQQIAWNLLNNAVKFTPAGGCIKIELNSDGRAAVLVVEDTGEGIDPDFLPHVFEMFRQADGTNSRRHGGLGIGLALVQQLVQLHHGTILAESAGANQGARFTVRLPLTNESPSVALSSLPAIAPLKPVALPALRFLIVDDSEDTVGMLEQFLKLSGAKVTSATNGGDALRLARETEFDVILSDISMPEMDGFEFLQRLRRIAGRERVPVIAITGFGRNHDIERARAAGFYSHLTKPLDLDALVDVLKQLRHTDGHHHSSSFTPRNNGSPAREA
jgi:two-component system CheB/CheR fusion protein